jgi:hypothetical protein
MNKAKAIATATYRDVWAGDLQAYLLPQKTTRGGTRVTVYRWFGENGSVVDGCRCGLSAARMLSHAQHHALFANVATI